MLEYCWVSLSELLAVEHENKFSWWKCAYDKVFQCQNDYRSFSTINTHSYIVGSIFI